MRRDQGSREPRALLRAFVPLSVALALGAIGACATVLGYDDLSDRPAGLTAADAQPEVAADAIDEADVADALPSGIYPPEPPAGAPVASGAGVTRWFVVERFYLGSQTHTGEKSNNAWREWGFDIDHVCTGATESLTNVGTCRRVDGATQDVLVDGDGCRDNNFGAQIVRLIRVYNDDFEAQSTTALIGGSGSWILRLDDLDTGADDAFTPGRLYRAAPLPKGTAPPKFDGTDVRSATSDSVIGGAIDRPVTSFPSGYVRGNVWVSGAPATFEVLVPIGDFGAPMQLVGAQFAATLSPEHDALHGGTLSGAMPATSIDTLVRPIAVKAGFCPGTALYDGFLKTVSKFPDLVVGAPNLQDVDVTCDAISIGVGLDFAPIKPVTQVIAPATPPPSKCGDAG